MIFNGQHPDVIASLDEETLADIQILWVDGIIGNRGHYEGSSQLISGLYNWMKKEGSKALEHDEVFPWITEYYTATADDRTPEEMEAVRQNANSIAFASFPGMEDLLRKDGLI